MGEYSVVPEAVTQSAAKIERVSGDVRAVGGAIQGTTSISPDATVLPAVAAEIAVFSGGVGVDVEKRADGLEGFAEMVRATAQTYYVHDQAVAASYGQAQQE